MLCGVVRNALDNQLIDLMRRSCYAARFPCLQSFRARWFVVADRLVSFASVVNFRPTSFNQPMSVLHVARDRDAIPVHSQISALRVHLLGQLQ